jgi:putative component of membrane protein insertase Oxa1/YidC/SpoIIIJ protein YidD
VKEFGPFKGFYLGIRRIMRCTPNNKRKGYDPVPINIKGVTKWIL